jgi:hypothetical protein
LIGKTNLENIFDPILLDRLGGCQIPKVRNGKILADG